MTTQEALKLVEYMDIALALDVDSAEIKKNILQSIKEVAEKQIPKKPIINKGKFDYVNYKIYMCPCCKQQIIKKIDGDIFVGKIPHYCDNCGQALDWSELNG